MKPHWMATALVLLVFADVARGQTDAVICGGSDRWPIKTSADTSQSILDAAAAATPKTVDDLLSKPKPSWSPPKSQYQSKAIPGDEGTTIRVRGWLYMIGHDPKDSDYHLQLVSDLNNCPDRSVIVEVPDDRCVVGANLVPFVRTARNEWDVMLKHQPTLHGGEAPTKPTEVIVTTLSSTPTARQLPVDGSDSLSDAASGSRLRSRLYRPAHRPTTFIGYCFRRTAGA